MTRYRLFITETRTYDAYVTADSPEEAKAKYERSEEWDATNDEQDEIEIGFHNEVTESHLEEVIQE